jgi:Tfp pilus assembly protein PilF
LPTIRYGLTRYDDPWLIRDNVLLQRFSWDALRRIFFDISIEQRLQLGAEYLPVRDLSVMLDFVLWGDWFGGHHLTQVVLYGCLCTLAAVLALELFGNRALAWFVGAAFAAHPVHVEAVAWLSERKGVLGGLLFFGAAVVGVRYLRVGGVGRLVGCLLLLGVAVLAKAHMVAGAGALAVCALWLSGIPGRRRWTLALAGLAVAAAAFVPFRRVSQAVGMVQPYHAGGIEQTLLLFAQVHGKYLELMALGGPYAVVYPIGPEIVSLRALALQILGSTALFLFAFFAIRGALRAPCRGAASFGLGWWLIFLAPVSHIVFPLQNLIADRYLLVGSWGLILVLGVGLVRLPARTGRLVALCWLVASVVWTVAQQRHWESSRALRLHAVTVHPAHVESWNRLASEAEERGDYEEAWRYIQEGLRRSEGVPSPERWRLFHRAGLIQRQRGDIDGAIRWMRLAARQPKAHLAHANLGLLLAQRGEFDEALSLVRQACEYQPRSAHNQRALGIVALETGEIDQACTAFERARALEPFNADNHFNSGLCELRRGNADASRTAFARAMELRPELAPRIEAVQR